jgi:hypothetical protein
MVRSFIHRRIRNVGIMMMAVALVWLWVRAMERNLTPATFATGYVMLAAVLFLAAYNVRKKLPFLPLASSTAWLQWHLYVGVGSMAVFALHTSLRWPTGVLETSLAALYVCTVASGLVGLYWTRRIPAQLARVGDEVIYERIPAIAQQVRRQAGDVVMQSVIASGATTLADFYVARLYDFFHRSRSTSYFFWPTTALRRTLMAEMQNLRRYLAEPELTACERLFALVRRKDDLDFHSARQGLLKTWLFVHIGLTYALVALAILHGLVALAFRGGAA